MEEEVELDFEDVAEMPDTQHLQSFDYYNNDSSTICS
jgi:hypothetical protein